MMNNKLKKNIYIYKRKKLCTVNHVQLYASLQKMWYNVRQLIHTVMLLSIAFPIITGHVCEMYKKQA